MLPLLLALVPLLLMPGLPAKARQGAEQGKAARVMTLPRAQLLVLDARGQVARRVPVEVAATQSTRARGMMFRRSYPPDAGMLFLWRAPRRVAMWMKNTYLPLDMVFIAADGTIVRVHENARPHDLTPIPSQTPVIAVLEVPAGGARRLGLRPGARVKLPPPPKTP